MSKLLILIPAYNEEGAVGGVVNEVHESMPGVPVLVIDDCSSDATAHVARSAGARILSLPHHLGLGGAVQAGYKLAFELGYDYVIRVDGDGQHDPCDIPKILDTLEREGCEMVIGSRFLDGSGEYAGPLRAVAIVFFRAVLRPILGRPVRDPTSDLWASIAPRWRFSAGVFRWNIPRSRRWWCCRGDGSIS